MKLEPLENAYIDIDIKYIFHDRFNNWKSVDFSLSLV